MKFGIYDIERIYTMISKHTTTPGSLTSLTMAAILEFFISGRISMNFGMFGHDDNPSKR